MMPLQLSEQQAKILYALKLDADQELTTIAQRLNLTPKAVRYHLDGMLRSGVASYAHFIDLYPLGIHYVNVYFSIAATERQLLELLIKRLIDSPYVTWLAHLGGDYHYGSAFAVRNFADLRAELIAILAQLQPLLFEKAINVHLSLKMLPPKMLGVHDAQTSIPEIQYGETTPAPQLDLLGKQLIARLSSSPELSLRELSRALGVSVATISVRLKKLKEQRVYRGRWLRVRYDAFGYSTHKLLIFAREIAPEFTKALHAYCCRHRHIDYILECVGEWDFEIGLVVESMEIVNAVTQELYGTFGSAIRMIKSLPLLKVLKWHQVPGWFAEQRDELQQAS